MTAVQALTDEEAYLFALLDDPSGIDLAEFCHLDETPGKADPCFRVRDYQWCLQGDTVMHTDEGRKAIRDCVGKVRLLAGGPGERGAWTDAEVRYFGRDQLWRIDLVRRNVRKTIYATADHRWFAGEGKADKRNYGEWTTRHLRAGFYLRPTVSPRVPLVLDRAWVQRGVVYGDGTRSKKRSYVRLFGAKMALASWFDKMGSPPRMTPGCSVFSSEIGSLPQSYKTDRPVVGRAGVAEMWGWLAGYFATDGSVLPDGTSVISSVSESSMVLVRDIATALGVVCSDVGFHVVMRCAPGSLVATPATAYRVVLRTSDLPEDFFLMDHHRARKQARGTRHRAVDAWRVVDVQPTDDWDDVYCAVVPGIGSFVLDGDILTGNCLWTSDERYQIDYMARDLGKTAGILLRAFAFPFNFPGQEMLITAPQLNHLGPIVDKVEDLFMRVRLGREMLPKQKGGGIKHQPQFQASFINGAKIMGRLPGPTSAGVKGQHAHRLELDEGQDFPKQAWLELIETMKDTPGAQWRAHGVSRGVRDKYYDFTMQIDPAVPFYVHRYQAMHRPGWSAKERDSKIALYGGSRDNPDYKRNIHGEHGDVSNPVFVLARLMACVRINESTWATEYNENVYVKRKLQFEHVQHSGIPIQDHLRLPASHLLQGYKSYWAGMDLGFTNDPSELLVFGLIKVGDRDVLRLLTRVHMMRIAAVDQAHIIEAVADFYGDRLKAISLDKTGVGLPIWQETVRGGRLHRLAVKIKGYGFSEKKAVEFDDRPLERRERPEDAVIEKNVIQYATDELRSLVDGGMIELPFDQELLTEFQGQTIQYSSDPSTNKPTRYGGGSFHNLDAAKLAVLGKSLESIEAVLGRSRRNGPVLDAFMGA